MSKRTYTDREVADLISRAVERQQEVRQREAAVGLSLEEIERIGRETGIDPLHLREAAAEMDSAGRTLSRQSGQTNAHLNVERWINAPLTPETWEDAVAEIQTQFISDIGFGGPTDGTVQQVGNAYEWRHTSGLGVQTTITASPRDDRTRLRLRQLVGFASPPVEGAVYGAALAGFLSMLAAGVSEAATVGVLTFLVLWIVAAPTITLLNRRWRLSKLRRLEDLADDLVPLFGAGGPSVRAAEAPRATPQLDLGALGDAPQDDRLSGGARVRE